MSARRMVSAWLMALVLAGCGPTIREMQYAGGGNPGANDQLACYDWATSGGGGYWGAGIGYWIERHSFNRNIEKRYELCMQTKGYR